VKVTRENHDATREDESHRCCPKKYLLPILIRSSHWPSEAIVLKSAFLWNVWVAYPGRRLSSMRGFTRCSATSFGRCAGAAESAPSPFVFVSQRGSPFTTAGFARMIERAAARAGLELKAHPHMLRHACWPTRGTTLGQFRVGLVIGRSPAPPSTRRWRRTGSRIFGGTDLGGHGRITTTR
jgi:hypothetical protein